jgi:hypothetical protein
MNVGDLVVIKNSEYSPFYDRPPVGDIGIVIEIDHNSFFGTIYYVQTADGIWRFSDYEVEPLDESR